MTKDEAAMFDKLAARNKAERKNKKRDVGDDSRSFHTHDDIYFDRSFGGWVGVSRGRAFLFSFDPATWASVVAFVSAVPDPSNGEKRYQAALRFHQGREHDYSDGDIHPIEVDLAAALERIVPLGGPAADIAKEALAKQTKP